MIYGLEATPTHYEMFHCTRALHALVHIVWPWGYWSSVQTRDTERNTVPTGLPGSSCLKVVEREMGGTTALDRHCSGSCPAWMASVPK